MKIKDIPHNERPYERCLHEGPENLTDAELLSIIIRTGHRNVNSMELAKQILALNYPNEGILGLLHLSLNELTKINGIGLVKGIQLLCIAELSKRIWKKKSLDRTRVFRDPLTIAEYYQEEMRHLEQEQMYLMMFNTKQILIRDIVVSKGTVNASLISPRELFIEALRYQAVAIILVHNHPSGDPEPSDADIKLTGLVAHAGEIIGIRLQDHIIIGDGAYISLKERGYI